MKLAVYRMMLYIGALAVVIFYFGPIFWTILTSLKPETEVYSLSLPSTIVIDRYIKVITSDRYIPTLYNSLRITLITVPLTLMVSSPAAYAIARFAEFRIRGALFLLFLVLAFLPHVAIAGYIYSLLTDMGLYDTVAGLIFTYTGVFTPITIWILTSYFRGIPKEIEEAALVDGASKRGVFIRIILPLSLPGIAIVGIICFILVWSEFLLAFTTTLTYNARPVTIGTLLFVGLLELQWSEVATAAMISIVPVVIMAFLTSTYIVRGLISGIIKG